jgi:capsid protein
MTGLNDRVMRVVLNEFRRRIQAWQHQIVAHQLCRRVWQAWLDRAFFAGALPIPAEYLRNPEPWAAVKWMPQGHVYLHPVQDAQASEKLIRAGLTTRSAVVSEQGEDSEQIDDEQAADNARADALGLRYDSDSRQSATATPPEAADDDSADAPPSQPEPEETDDDSADAPPSQPEPEETAA